MPEQANEAKHSSRPAQRVSWLKLASILLTLIVLAMVSALAYHNYQLAYINIQMAQHVTALQKVTENNQTKLATLESLLAQVQQDGQKSQALSEKQEQIIADWQAAQKGDLNKWYVAEAQYLVKLANDHLQFTHDTTLALTLIQRAEQVLQGIQDPSLLDLRKSLATDLEKVKSISAVDVSAIYLKLNAIDVQVDQLPFPLQPLSVAAAEKISTTLPADTHWWQKILIQTRDALHQIVIVRNTNEKSLPLVLPQEKQFFRLNLHSQLQDAMWAVLHHRAAIYEASLGRSQKWIEQYFDQTATLTKTTQETLQALRQINIQPSTIDLAETLRLFDDYFARHNQSSQVGV
jgi:uroporphyrin-3 C-methyltransferase